MLSYVCGCRAACPIAFNVVERTSSTRFSTLLIMLQNRQSGQDSLESTASSSSLPIRRRPQERRSESLLGASNGWGGAGGLILGRIVIGRVPHVCSFDAYERAADRRPFSVHGDILRK
jgi:hypothetical protein